MHINKKMIFHYPGPFYEVLDSGEKKRPKRMYEAFCELGYEVYLINGTFKERKDKFLKIKNIIKSFSFIYSENSTLPLTMTGRYHIPKFFSVDKELFKFAYKNNISIGVYYRDLYWMYRTFKKEIGILKYYISLPFYKDELKFYSKYINALFVQSPEFKKVVPYYSQNKIYELPPGGDGNESVTADTDFPLQLIYVGSITPPIYDISQAIKTIKTIKDKSVKLNLVIRESEKHFIEDYYGGSNDCIIIHHASGSKLHKLLKKSHISLMFYKKDEYRKLVKPLKLFEAIAFGLPVITNSGTATAEFIKKNNFGWVLYEENELINLINQLKTNIDKISAQKKSVMANISKNTWTARAITAQNILLNNVSN